jgi:hypothetical protein
MRQAEAANIALDLIVKCGYDLDNYAVAQVPPDVMDPNVLWNGWTNDPKYAGDRIWALISLLGESSRLSILAERC